MEWVENVQFCPLLSHHDVSATVEVVMDNIVVEDGACARCHEKADDTKLLQTIKSYKWERIADIDLESVVSICVLYVMFVYHM